MGGDGNGCGIGMYYIATRQMMIIAGGEPELCHRRHAKREGGGGGGGVYAPPYAFCARIKVLSRMQCACVVLM